MQEEYLEKAENVRSKDKFKSYLLAKDKIFSFLNRNLTKRNSKNWTFLKLSNLSDLYNPFIINSQTLPAKGN